MAYGNTVSVVGNVTRDPEIRFTPSGKPVCSFGVAWNHRYDRDGEKVESTSFFDVKCWGSLAENVGSSIEKGTRVLIEGRLDQQSFTDKEGNARRKVEIIADDVAPSLRWATAQVTRNERTDSGQPRRETGAPGSAGAPGPLGDEEPF